MTTFFDDVGAFHARFGLPHALDPSVAPSALDPDALVFRLRFMLEELAEYALAQGAPATANALRQVEHDVALLVYSDVGHASVDLPAALDALVDLTYVVAGTAQLSRLPFNEAWAEVHRANLTKVRAASAADPRSRRGHALDVVKPPGFTAPDHAPLLRARGWRP